MKKIVICGGHLTPALALIEELEKRDAEIHFFGRKYSTEGSESLSAEYNIINSKKIKFYTIKAGRLQRRITKYTATSLLKVPVGLVNSIYYLSKIKPDYVVSFGGYISLPVTTAARILGIKYVIHEQSSMAGLANRITARFASKIFLTWSTSQKYFPKNKSEIIGNLIRSDFQTTTTKPLTVFKEKDKKIIYVTGGNQGSHFINNFIFNNLKIFKNYNLFHQIGTANFKDDHQNAKKIQSSNYHSVDYLDSKDIANVIKSAHIIISRSGANTVFEIASAKKPAIFVPLPFSAGNEQYENAKILKDAGTAIIINQSDFTSENLISAISKIENEYQMIIKAAASFQKNLPTNAAKKLADFILQ